MERDEATYRAYDGVRLELFNDAVVECPPLTVAEAVHFLRALKDVRDDRPGAHEAFMGEFPERIGITDQRLADLGLVVKGADGSVLDLGDLTYSDAVALCEQIAVASWSDDVVARSEAQIAVLDEWPATFGITEQAPPQVFETARTFAKEFYLLIYGLAQDFCSHLTASPPVKVLTLRASSPMKGSTT